MVGRKRWSVPPSQVGRFTLKGNARVQNGLTAEVTGTQPGLTAIDFDVLDASGKSIESQKYPLCIPQFVTVDVDLAFMALLQNYQLIDFEIDQVLGVAREVCNALLSRANVRTIWRALGEALPAQFGAGQPGANMVTRATFQDTSGSAALYGQTSAPFGPAVFDETIDIFAGAFDDPVSGNANENLDEVTNEVVSVLIGSGLMSSPQKDLGLQVLGRVYGETLAHEICHSLIGPTLTSLPDHHHNVPAVTGDLMNRGIDRAFEIRTGCSLNGGRVTTPLTDNLSLLPGISAINVPTGLAQAQIDLHFPVPPAFS